MKLHESLSITIWTHTSWQTKRHQSDIGLTRILQADQSLRQGDEEVFFLGRGMVMKMYHGFV
jgi:hypothetical protein